MKREQRQALQAAIKLMEDRIADVSVDAILCDQFGATYPHAQRCSEERKKLQRYENVLREMLGGEKQQ